MYRLATTGLLGLAALAGTVSLEVSGATPRLVVGIVVDQLRTDQIDQLQSLFGEKGFKVLMRDGAYLRDVDFKTPGLDASSGTAAVMTGSWPAYTGVPTLNASVTIIPKFSKSLGTIRRDISASCLNFSRPRTNPQKVTL